MGFPSLSSIGKSIGSAVSDVASKVTSAVTKQPETPAPATNPLAPADANEPQHQNTFEPSSASLKPAVPSADSGLQQTWGAGGGGGGSGAGVNPSGK
ncbi:MAG TPA: hypothetical protein VND93_18740 [Myxococcales bacterium]|jgi:hypothetical protein|nr:hypothetical protein [Myxococcales bacterium]